MKAKDLRSKAPKDLGEELLKLRREQFNLRMARATGQAAKSLDLAASFVALFRRQGPRR